MPQSQKRYEDRNWVVPIFRVPLFSALRACIREEYSKKDLRSDLLAGIVVGLIAIPLSMALAIASGVPPQYGLYTAIVGGATVAFLGGSRFQVTGPTAAFVVILAPISEKFGFAGLLLAGFLAGFMLLAMGMSRLGGYIRFVPHPVTTGFTSGIGLVIATLQLRDFFGLKIAQMPENYLHRLQALYSARHTFSPYECLIGAGTLVILLGWTRYSKKIPAPLVALFLASLFAYVFNHMHPELAVSTIGSRFGGIPRGLPHLTLPWNFSGAAGTTFHLNWQMLRDLLPSAFAIAMLGAIESLLSATVADGMAKTRHNPDSELMALGIGNILCPFFGGIAATGAIARTATNIRYGAKSPLAAVFHAIFILFAILFLAPMLSYLPMAALAALLMLVAYNMSEIKHFSHMLRVAPRSDVMVLLLCFGCTVFFDMVVGVTVGVVFAALLFMRRMADLTSGTPLEGRQHEDFGGIVPKDILIYEIAGPMFFGAAEKAMGALSHIDDEIRTVIFDLEDVPVLDFTGIVAFESAVNKILSLRRKVILVGLKPQPLRVLKKAGFLEKDPPIRVCKTLKEALEK